MARDAQRAPLVRRPARLVAGVDGCRAGWVVVLRELSTGRMTLHVEPDFAAVLAHGAQVYAVDMPIGLAVRAERGGRPCDRETRALLGPRASSVFSPPTLAALAAHRAGRDYRAVAAANRAGDRDAPGLSLQTFNIIPKIAEVDAALATSRADVREAHPELCFAAANAMRPLRDGKRTPEGRRQRERILRREGFLVRSPRLPGVQPDDILDACITCWTASRIARGHASPVPLVGEPQVWR